MNTIQPSIADAFNSSIVRSRESTTIRNNAVEEAIVTLTSMDNETASLSALQNYTCVPEYNYYTIAFQSFILPALIFNLILFVAAIFDQEKLTRQNYLFASVISTLLSNIIYIVTLEWVLLDNYAEVPIQKSMAGVMSSAKYVWVLEESVNIAMPFLICGNIVCLTYVTVKSATYVGRVANTEDPGKGKRRFSKVRLITRIMIVTSWAVPILLTILGMTTMNCVLDCVCTSTNFAGDLCPNRTDCSTFWAPVTKSYIWLNFALWSAAALGLFTLIGMSIIECRKTQTALPISDQGYVTGCTNNTEMSNLPIQKTKSSAPPSRGSFKIKLNPRLRFALVLTAVYVTCSACFTAAIAVDTLRPDTSDMLVFGLSRIAMYLYTAVCPIIMVWHLPVLKISLVTLFRRIQQINRTKS